MSSLVARDASSSTLDVPKFVFNTLVWGWFIYRTGEFLFYFLLRKFKIPHVPKFQYNHNLKLSENMTLREKWKKKSLFSPDDDDLRAIDSSQQQLVVKQPTLKRRRFVAESGDASHTTLVEKVEDKSDNHSASLHPNSAAASNDEEITATDRLEFERGLSRRKRKTLKKQEKRDRRMKLVEKINEVKSKDDKKKNKSSNKNKESVTFNFEPISKLLAEETTDSKKQPQPQQKTTTNVIKKKNKNMKSEIQQFTNVVNHPVFQSNPLASIQLHLRNKMATIQPNPPSSQQHSKTSNVAKQNSKTNPSSSAQKIRRKLKLKKRSDDSFDPTQTVDEGVGKRKRND
ncbi:hypothetical protein C9374_010229 [Naegleria lovaniensis]|uniref:Uncharacterized protein n=1 Tax=Naegleria lovaniensis TaxID=51637 RepID=A0AA88KDN7_NAELO|nr:uncharacterized protein C9374_010229 [Naegleria lovaniensis]KAG2374855.1 hypothetical protein C9374_010229 [Naegleria lovaniensis]